MSAPKKPSRKVTIHPITAAIWRNVNPKGEPFFTATFERAYRDQQGNWKSSNSFSVDEVLLLAKVADLAHTELVNLRAPGKADRQD
jgi:hypothetical protein